MCATAREHAAGRLLMLLLLPVCKRQRLHSGGGIVCRAAAPSRLVQRGERLAPAAAIRQEGVKDLMG